MSPDFESVYLSLEERFSSFKALILEKNRHLNLTRIVSDEDFKYKNIEDSIMPLFLSKFFSFSFFKERRRVLDIGTGGGFPLIPLAILLSDSSSQFDIDNVSAEVLDASFSSHRIKSPVFYGLDSVKKKIHAVEDVALSLGLSNVHFLADRAEIFGRDPLYRETFDCVIGRAVAEVPVLLEYSVPFVKVGGYICMYKSADIEAEMCISDKTFDILGVRLVECLPYSLSHQMGARNFLVYKKVKKTTDKYPRNAGVAKKNPLI